DFADLVAKKVNQGDCMGILICGSGQGMAMRANRYPLVKAALCWTPEVAKLAREHNSANILCLGARLIDESTCVQIVKTFFTTAFAEGRHTHRVRKMEKPC
ncbi:MAG: RpiB/LacA/LacB family sugar-phosphate isomerase, partial [Pseudobdellovibrionaceae bacterium]